MKKEQSTSWEQVKAYVAYFVSFLAFVVVVQSIYHRDKDVFNQLNLDKIKSLPTFSADHLKISSDYQPACRWESCFEIFNCTEINFYLYPLNRRTIQTREITPKVSKEFYFLYKALSASKYYTSDIENACLKIAPYDFLSLNADTKNIGAILNSLPNWNGGKNFIFFNFNNLNPYEFPIGDGIIASSDLHVNEYRYDFDLPVSYYSTFLERIPVDTDKIFKGSRKFDILIVGHQTMDMNYQIERIQKDHYQEYNVLLVKPCLNENLMCDRYENSVKIPEVFGLSKYCLITTGINGKFQSAFLAASLGSGCIPIIAADNVLLPFDTKIDWPALSVRIPSHYIESSLISTLDTITLEDVKKMRQKCLYVYSKFFSSMEAVLQGTVTHLSDRIFPHLSSSYEYWNGPLGGVRSPIVLNNIATNDGFTAVILAYERIDSLYRVIQGVTKAPSLKKVLVIWNNQKKSPPPSEEWPLVAVPIVIIKTNRNVLSNRFYPYDEIETDCVLSIDDDIVMLTPDEIEFGYQTWREFPDRLVGYPPRLHLYDEEQGDYKYNSEWTNELSIILTGGSFYHKYYSHAYSHVTPAHIRDWVDDHMNCEDILMNFVIANATGKAPIKVSPRKKFRCLECSNQSSISIDPGHMVERSECINFFRKEYGTMPLKTVQFRADPVLYKDDPKKMNKESVDKKYADMNEL